MIDIHDISDFINQKSILQQDLVERHIKSSQVVKEQQLFLDDLEAAAEAIKNIAKTTQEQIKYKISEAATLMLQSVFDDPPEIDVEFEIRRNQTECIISFKKNGELYSPLEEEGFGKGDVAGYGLRLSIWSLPAQRSRAVMILDEPGKHIKGDEANIAFIQAVKKLSKSLGMQVIMISDERVPFEEISDGADRVFKVEMINDESFMEVIK